MERAKVERSRAAIADNRVPSKVGDYEYERSRGFLFCASCGRAMMAAARRFREKGTAYHYYYCPKNHTARGMLPECPNRKSHPAIVLEHNAAELFQESMSQETLLELYDRAIEQQNGSGNESRISQRRAALSERLSTLATMRDKFQRQEAEDLMTLDELPERLAERGPVWPVIDWLLWWALVRAGEHQLAERIRESSLEQIAEGGFAEYFEPFTGEPLGSREQSWTAAVALDWLASGPRHEMRAA